MSNTSTTTLVNEAYSFTARRKFPAGTPVEVTKVAHGRAQVIVLDGSGHAIVTSLRNLA